MDGPGLPVTDPVLGASAEDPEIEVLQYSGAQPKVNISSTPFAAWVLVTLFLLSVIQKNCADNVIGEMFQLFAEASLHRRSNKPY